MKNEQEKRTGDNWNAEFLVELSDILFQISGTGLFLLNVSNKWRKYSQSQQKIIV
jgi:hypothetical protein